jgi:Zn finger protein HypA/HybF involved in hydrogenase expression
MTIQKHTKKTLLARLKKFTDEKKRLPNTHNTKLQLIKTKLLENKCEICNLTEWRGSPISLHLDHKDGNATNNNISNLRLLCPNCHSQTETYCGKNSKRKYKKAYCKDCNKKLSTSWGVRCFSCYRKQQTMRTKIDWPKQDELRDLVFKRTNMEDLAKFLGVSSNALRKRCRKYNIDWHHKAP